ncbi:MAG: hypothetical protein H8D23_27330 [Candidatus Brocadiales bacterium]|nr:hypothetical protein [Candidatus Brocadiales bacterium]
MNKDVQKFGSDLRQKIEIFTTRFDISSHDLRKMLDLPKRNSSEITSDEVVEIRTFPFHEFVAYFNFNADKFMFGSVCEFEKLLDSKSVDVVMKKCKDLLKAIDNGCYSK